MNELDKILSYFHTTRKGNSVWKDYGADGGELSRAVFYRKLETLVARGDLRQTVRGYERTRKAGPFWDYVVDLSNWLNPEYPNKIHEDYVRYVIGDNNPDKFIRAFRKLVDDSHFLSVAEFIQTLYERPKLGLSHIEMFLDSQDSDGSTRAQWLKVVRDNIDD